MGCEVVFHREANHRCHAVSLCCDSRDLCHVGLASTCLQGLELLLSQDSHLLPAIEVLGLEAGGSPQPVSQAGGSVGGFREGGFGRQSVWVSTFPAAQEDRDAQSLGRGRAMCMPKPLTLNPMRPGAR